MARSVERLMVDSSVILKWRITTEEYAAQADEMLLDGEQGTVELCASDQVFAEVMSACLKALRRGRLSDDEAQAAIDELLAYPFTIYKTTRRIVKRAFQIARQENQRAYDCAHVALAERKGIEFWTGDERLYNALHAHFPFVRWIADYQRKRPQP